MTTTCDTCEMNFDETVGSDVRLHNGYHKRLRTIADDNNLAFMPYSEREATKASFYQEFAHASTTAKYTLALEYLHQYFWRSVSPYARDNVAAKHPDFKTYAGHLLATEHFRDLFADVYGELCRTYPPIPGARDGATTWSSMTGA